MHIKLSLDLTVFCVRNHGINFTTDKRFFLDIPTKNLSFMKNFTALSKNFSFFFSTMPKQT